MLLLTAYVLQQRFAPFLSLRLFNQAVESVAIAGRVKASTTPAARVSHRSEPRAVARVATSTVVGRARRKSSWFEPDTDAIVRLRASRVRDRFRLQNASVVLGLVMQRVMEDYNSLESTYLVSSMMILLSGMVFRARGFHVGTAGYQLLTAAVVLIVIVATVMFVLLLAIELYKSFRDAGLHAALRDAEAASIESALRMGVRSKQQRDRERDRDRDGDRDGDGASGPGSRSCGDDRDHAHRDADDSGSLVGGARVDTVGTSKDSSAFVVDNPLRTSMHRKNRVGASASGPVAGHAGARTAGGPSPAMRAPPTGAPAFSDSPNSAMKSTRVQRVRVAQRPVLSTRVDEPPAT